jgi:DNA-binding XRE family transcriptional regulator
MNHTEPTMACLTNAAPEQMLVVAAKNGMRKAIELRKLAKLSTEETARRIGVSVAGGQRTALACEKGFTKKIEPLSEVQFDA